MKLHGLYAIADYASPLLCTATPAKLNKLLTAEISLLQYRDKESAPSLRKQRAQQLLLVCRQKKISFIINDDVLLAKEINADGVHLGKDDMPLTQARALLGNKKIIGVSCYQSLERAQSAQEQGADYIALGAVFPSSTQPLAKHLSLEQLKQYCSALKIPVCAIGGINATNAQQVLNAGTHFIAVAQGIFGQAQPQQAIAALRKHITYSSRG